jgi:hypothetical protein
MVIPGNETESEIRRLVNVHLPTRHGSPIASGSTAVTGVATALVVGLAVGVAATCVGEAVGERGWVASAANVATGFAVVAGEEPHATARTTSSSAGAAFFT